MAPKKGGKIGYNKPKPFAAGVVLTDLRRNKWEIIKNIGGGGFADVYAVKKPGVSNDDEYAVKIEPKENGPLFVEINFYLTFLQPVMLKKWQTSNENLSFLGIPEYHGSGSYNLDGDEHRFLVTNRFGNNITTKLRKSSSNNDEISLHNVSIFLQQIIDSLYFIHDKGYVHGDIKSENLLLRYNNNNNSSNADDQVYLIDFGLVRPCYENQEIIVEKKKAQDGTLAFSSRDAHLGIATKRSDLESLAYVVLTWFDYRLPWTDEKKPEIVKQKKHHFMNNEIDVLSDRIIIPKQIIDFIRYVNTLEHLQNPDYRYLKELFRSIDDADRKATTKRFKVVNIRESNNSDAEVDNCTVKPAEDKKKAERTMLITDVGNIKKVEKIRMTPKKGGKIGYNKPKPFAAGVVLTDLRRNKWEIIKNIGGGGFADVYAVKKPGVSNDDEYAVKIEPKENGPLFVEINFYLTFLQPVMLKKWQTSNENLSFLGIPEYHGSGSYNLDGDEHRFLVTNRFGNNITTKLRKSSSNNDEISLHNVSIFLQQIIDSLYFIHAKGYVHGDIKSENLLLRYNNNNNNSSNADDQVYLIDFGLVRPCYENQEIIVEKKKAQDGTLAFSSRDAHLGIATKRSDLESLAYVVLTWFDYRLPWTDEKKPEIVKQKKHHFMNNEIDVLSDRIIIPKQIIDFIRYVNTLEHLQNPDYGYLKELFRSIDDADRKATTKPFKVVNIRESNNSDAEVDNCTVKPAEDKRTSKRIESKNKTVIRRSARN